MNQQLQQVPPAILARRRNRINGLIGKTERQLEQSLRWLRWLYAPLGIYFWVMVCFVAVCIGLLLWGKDLTFWLPITLIACILLATLAATNPGWERTRYVAEQKIEAMIALQSNPCRRWYTRPIGWAAAHIPASKRYRAKPPTARITYSYAAHGPELVVDRLSLCDILRVVWPAQPW